MRRDAPPGPLVEELERLVAGAGATGGAAEPGEGGGAGGAGRAAERLAASAGGDREALEELRSALLRRLHLPGADAGDARRLRLVEAALARVPREVEAPWTWQRRQRRPPRRRR